MKSEVAVSKHCNILSPVEKCVAHSTVADTSSLKFLNPRNCRSLSFASCGKDHTDGVKITCCCLYCKSIKPANPQYLYLQDPHA